MFVIKTIYFYFFIRMSIHKICNICNATANDCVDLSRGYLCNCCQNWFCDKHCLLRNNGHLYHTNGEMFDIIREKVCNYVIEVNKFYMMCPNCRKNNIYATVC